MINIKTEPHRLNKNGECNGKFNDVVHEDMNASAKKIINKQEFYDLLCGLSYIGVVYKLKMDGRDLEELSPGKRGIVLLVFYLDLSKKYIPIDDIRKIACNEQ